MTSFLKDLGIDIKTILNELNGSLKLGIKFKDFYKEGESFNHPFGENVFESFNISYMMDNDTVPDNILEYNEIATHFDVRELMQYLDNVLPQFKNLIIERGEVTDINELKEQTIVDCTGFRKSIINQFLPNNFNSIIDKIPNNTALVYRAPYKNKNQKVPYTTCQAMDNGWIWNIPLGDQLSIGYVHDNKNNVLKEFIKYIVSIFGECHTEHIIEIPMITGRNEKHIYEGESKTIIALGLSSFFIEPLESTGLYLVQYGIKCLDKYLKEQISADYYNTDYNNEFDVILDFIIAHYKYSDRTGEYWEYYKDLEIQEYRENNIFPVLSWEYILKGFDRSNFKPVMDRSFFSARKGTKYCEKDFT